MSLGQLAGRLNAAPGPEKVRQTRLLFFSCHSFLYFLQKALLEDILAFSAEDPETCKHQIDLLSQNAVECPAIADRIFEDLIHKIERESHVEVRFNWPTHAQQALNPSKSRSVWKQ